MNPQIEYDLRNKKPPVPIAWPDTKAKLYTKTGEEIEVAHRFHPHPKQVEAWRRQQRHLLFGGARGPGKTRASMEKALTLALRWPGIPLLIARKDLEDLRRTSMKIWIERVCPKEFYAPQYGGKYLKSREEFTLFNGSTVTFVEMKDYKSHRSANYGGLFFEELLEFTEDAYGDMDATLRWTTPQPGECRLAECRRYGNYVAHSPHPRYQIFSTTNPHPGWIKDRWYTPWKQAQEKKGEERPNHAFVQATTFDNPSLPPDYIPSLYEGHDDIWVMNFVYGNWDAFEGMTFESWNSGEHVVHGALPKFVRLAGGIDYGTDGEDSHRTCQYLIGQEANGDYITFAEYSEQGTAAAGFFNSLAELNIKHNRPRWWADPTQSRANQLLRTEKQITVHDAPRYQGARDDGIGILQRLIDPKYTRPDGRVGPQLRVHESCKRLIGAISTYQGKRIGDDEIDAWRYAAMNITDGVGVMEPKALSVVGVAGATPVSRAGTMMQREREARHARYRQVLDTWEREDANV